MKKMFYYLLVFTVLCFGIDTMIDYSLGQQIKNQSPYQLAFASTGANLLESRMDCWAKINTNTNSDEDALDEMLCEILSCLQIPINNNRILHEKNKEQIVVSYEMTQASEWNFLQIKTDKISGETYFLMSSVSSESDERQHFFEQVLQKKMKLTVYYRYTGLIKERTTAEGREKLADMALKSLGANKMDDYQDAILAGGTGYSNRLENRCDTIILAGKKMNLQLAVKCSQNDQNTIVYIGFPLLLNDY